MDFPEFSRFLGSWSFLGSRGIGTCRLGAFTWQRVLARVRLHSSRGKCLARSTEHVMHSTKVGFDPIFIT